MRDVFTARPERLIGNVALSSLVAGLPLGLLISLLAAWRAPTSMPLPQLAGDVVLAALAAPVFVFVCGLLVVAPALLLLRAIGLGGPFFVHALALAVAVPFFANGPAAGAAVSALALAAGVVFCRFAYPANDA